MLPYRERVQNLLKWHRSSDRCHCLIFQRSHHMQHKLCNWQLLRAVVFAIPAANTGRSLNRQLIVGWDNLPVMPRIQQVLVVHGKTIGNRNAHGAVTDAVTTTSAGNSDSFANDVCGVFHDCFLFSCERWGFCLIFFQLLHSIHAA